MIQKYISIASSFYFLLLLRPLPCIIDLNKSSSKAGRINHFYNDKWFSKIFSLCPSPTQHSQCIWFNCVFIIFSMISSWFRIEKMYATNKKITYNKIFSLPEHFSSFPLTTVFEDFSSSFCAFVKLSLVYSHHCMFW